MPTSNADLRELQRFLDDWLVRLRLRDALFWAARGLMGGLAAGLGVALVARFRPLLPVPALALFAVAAALLGFAIAMAVAYFWPRSSLAAARYFDRLFGLAERTSTALELALAPAATPAWLVRDQCADALLAARAVNPAPHLRVRVPRVEWLALATVAMSLVAALVVPNAQQDLLAQQQAVQQAIAEQIKQIEAIREQIESNPNLTDAQKEALTQPLEDAQKALEEGDLTQEQALQALTEAQQELQALADPNAQNQAEALSQAGEALSQNPLTQDAGAALSSGDLLGAADALANMDLSQLSDAERQALADQLEQAAQQLQDSNPETAAQLQAAADALRQGDVSAAQAALDAAAQAIEQTTQAAAQAQAASNAAGQISEAQRAVAQAGSEGNQGNQGNQGNGTQGNNGNGDGQGNQGNGNGNGNNNGNGQGHSAGEGGTSEGGGSGGYEEIYTPYLTGAGEDVTLNNSEDPTGEVVGEGNVGPQNTGDVTVPYNEVFSGYSDAAYSAIEEGDYPADMTDIIRQYFSSLQP